jgi:hypothetical protein
LLRADEILNKPQEPQHATVSEPATLTR